MTPTLLEGKIHSGILRFAFPMFFGYLFQQLYSTIDAIIVGNFLGDTELAAVTGTGSLVFLLTGFVIGLYTGVDVQIATYFGAQDSERLDKAVHTGVVFGLISGVLLTVFGVVFSPLLVSFMDTPIEVYDSALIYLRTYFSGIFFLALYNTFCGIFRSIGDSKRPLYYLLISSITNVILDILFVGPLGLGIAGAALATILSQLLSMVLAFIRLYRIKDDFDFQFRKLSIDRDIFRKILRIGLPAGIQNSVIGFANVIVQSSINSFGQAAMASNGAYTRIEGFVFIPIQCFSQALTTFVSQNLGAGNIERIKRGARFGIVFSCICAEAFGLLYLLFAPYVLGLFGGGSTVIQMGVERSTVATFFYCFLAFAHIVSSILRGASRTKTPMFIMLGIWCVLRVTYIELVAHFTDNIVLVYWAYPLTWVISCIFFALCYLKLLKDLDSYKMQGD